MNLKSLYEKHYFGLRPIATVKTRLQERSGLIKNLLAEISHFYTPKYKNLFNLVGSNM